MGVNPVDPPHRHEHRDSERHFIAYRLPPAYIGHLKIKNMQTNIKLYSLDYRDVKTYLTATAFIGGNILLPQLCHLFPQGGITWLPIYLFTLAGAYKYGWRVGLMTAIASPLINSALFGMPSPTVLPTILIKSVMLALAASWTAYRTKRISIPLLAAVVLFYQITGSLAEWALTGEFGMAIQDFRKGIPGMLLQVFGGYFILRHFTRK